MGDRVPLEQPTQIKTRPLRMTDQDDRIRAIFGLTSDDPLPESSYENVRKYHAYVAMHLALPFEAAYREETGPFESSHKHPVTVVGLADLDCYEPEEVGLLFKVRHDVPDQTNRRVRRHPVDLLCSSGPWLRCHHAQHPDVVSHAGQLPPPSKCYTGRYTARHRPAVTPEIRSAKLTSIRASLSLFGPRVPRPHPKKFDQGTSFKRCIRWGQNMPSREADRLTAVWQQIEQRRPKSIRDNPKTERRVGFLLGLATGKLTGRVLRKLLGGGK